MSKLSKAARKISSTVIGKFGGDIIYKRIINGIYNTSTGAISESITSVNISGVFQNVNQRETNDLIKENDKICIIAAKDLDFIPSTSDKITKTNIDYQIIRIFTDENDNSNIKYELYLRA
tara:strand:+ start:333 stop:692 length:360 start_codon:yes stop_codon:yes gene_type:complete